MLSFTHWKKIASQKFALLFPAQYVPLSEVHNTKSKLKRLSAYTFVAGLLSFLAAVVFKSPVIAYLSVIPFALARYYQLAENCIYPEVEPEAADPNRKHLMSIQARRVSKKHEATDE